MHNPGNRDNQRMLLINKASRQNAKPRKFWGKWSSGNDNEDDDALQDGDIELHEERIEALSLHPLRTGRAGPLT